MESVLLRPHKSTGDLLELWSFLSGARRKQVQGCKKVSSTDDSLPYKRPTKQELEDEAERRKPLLMFQKQQQQPEQWASGSLEPQSEKLSKLFKDGPGKWLASTESVLEWTPGEPGAHPSKLPHYNWSEECSIMASSRIRGRAHQPATAGARSLRRARRTKVAGRLRRLASSTPALSSQIVILDPTWTLGDAQVNGDSGQHCPERIEAQQRLSDSGDTHSNRLAAPRRLQGHTLLDLEGLVALNQSHWPAPVHGSFMPELAPGVTATSGGGLERWHLTGHVAPSNDNDNGNDNDNDNVHSHCHSPKLLPNSTLGLHNESPLTNDNGIGCELQVAIVSGCGADHESEQAPRSPNSTISEHSSNPALQQSSATTTTTQHLQQPPVLSQQLTLQYPQRASRLQQSEATNQKLTCSTDHHHHQQQHQQANDDSQKSEQQNRCAQLNSERQMASAAHDKGDKLLLRPLQCSSWLQVLQPRHSGSYQVVQEASGAVSVSGADDHKQEVEAANTNTGTHPIKQQVVQQISRPGRSPVSLQRQTNARLARHMFRLQQQQQLELEVISAPQCHDKQQQVQVNSSRSSTSCHNEGRLKQQAYLAPDRLSFTYSKSARDSRGTRAVRAHESCTKNHINTTLHQKQHNNRLENCTNLATTRNQKHQVIRRTSNNPSWAIEICDKQLACSSRQIHQAASNCPGTSSSCLQQAAHKVNQQQTNQSQKQVNVVVYKSVNMLRNVNPDSGNPRCSSSCPKEVTALAAGHTRETDDNGSIDSTSGSTLSLNKPFCKICHMSSAKNGDKLISPCKCSGTMQYIHCGCLLKWLEISNRTNEKPISCELCSHEYSWHKKFNYKQMQFPSCSLKDFFLHLFFFVALGFMLGCVISPILQRRSAEYEASKLLSSATQQEVLPNPRSQDPLAEQQQHEARTISGKGKKIHQSVYAPHLHHSGFGARPGHLSSGHLAQEEKLMLICAAVFFISFFSAIYSQTIARDSVYGLFVKFLNMNRTYYITEYDHGQLNNNNNTTCSGNKQQQQLTDGRSWLDRKFSSEEH